MILKFSTQINGKPTFFAEKIKKSLRTNINYGFGQMYVPPDFNFYVLDKCNPKHHTIRKDDNNELNEGDVIEMRTNPGDFVFAPPITIISTQKIVLEFDDINFINILIDNKFLELDELVEFVKNDGFDSYTAFHDYFYSKMQELGTYTLRRKLIHWTTLKY